MNVINGGSGNNNSISIRISQLKDQKILLDKCINELEHEIVDIDSGRCDKSLKNILDNDPISENYRKLCSVYCKFQAAPKLMAGENYNQSLLQGNSTSNGNSSNNIGGSRLNASANNGGSGNAAVARTAVQNSGVSTNNANSNPQTQVDNKMAGNSNLNPNMKANPQSIGNTVINNTNTNPGPTGNTTETKTTAVDITQNANTRNASAVNAPVVTRNAPAPPTRSTHNAASDKTVDVVPVVTRSSVEAAGGNSKNNNVNATAVISSPTPPTTRQAKSAVSPTAPTTNTSNSPQASIANSKPKRKIQEITPAPAPVVEVRRSTRGVK